MYNIKILEGDVVKYNEEALVSPFKLVNFIADNGVYGLTTLLNGERYNYPLDSYIKRGYVQLASRKEAYENLIMHNAKEEHIRLLFNVDIHHLLRFGFCKIYMGADQYVVTIENCKPEDICHVLDLTQFVKYSENKLTKIKYSNSLLKLTYSCNEFTEHKKELTKENSI